MGVLQSLRSRRQERVTAAHAGAVTDPSNLPIATPWGSSNLERIVADDVFGANRPVNTRAAAMRIPAVARGNNLMKSSIAGFPLVLKRGANLLDPQPAWPTRAVDGLSPQLRIAWTVDDLVFYGWSCWWRNNSRVDGFPLNVGRVEPGRWAINADLRVEVDGREVPDDSVILIPGIHEGILTYGRDTLDDTRTLYANVRKRLATPTPGLNLQQTDGRDLTDDEIDTLIGRWAAARQGQHGGVSFTNKHIKPEAISGDDGNLMIESRNAAAVDIARLIGVSAGLIDATTPKASLNYETKDGRNEEFVDRDLNLYMQPIAWRLSLDDICPHGQHAAFDTAAFTDVMQPATGPALED